MCGETSDTAPRRSLGQAAAILTRRSESKPLAQFGFSAIVHPASAQSAAVALQAMLSRKGQELGNNGRDELASRSDLFRRIFTRGVCHLPPIRTRASPVVSQIFGPRPPRRLMGIFDNLLKLRTRLAHRDSRHIAPIGDRQHCTAAAKLARLFNLRRDAAEVSLHPAEGEHRQHEHMP